MKTATVELLKFKKLVARLSGNRCLAVGALQAIWMFTARNAPAGDIGRYENEDIAIEIGWIGDPDVLIDALVETGWLDKSESHRLIVHDWPDHCENHVKALLAKHGRSFCDEYTRKPTEPPRKKKTSNATRRKRCTVFDADSIVIPPEIDSIDVRIAIGKWLEHKKNIGKGYKDAASVSSLLQRFVRQHGDSSQSVFIDAVEYSISQNYQGIYIDSSNNHAHRTSTASATGTPRHDRETRPGTL